MIPVHVHWGLILATSGMHGAAFVSILFHEGVESRVSRVRGIAMELLTSRTSPAKLDSIPWASSSCASSLCRLGPSRKDQTCRSCLSRSIPGRRSLWKLCRESVVRLITVRVLPNATRAPNNISNSLESSFFRYQFLLLSSIRSLTYQKTSIDMLDT